MAEKTWTDIIDGAVATGGLPSGEVMTAIRDNLIAAQQAVNGSPFNWAVWHPYNWTPNSRVDTTEDGLIYDSAVDGMVASIETPDFDDGWEYALDLEDVRPVGAGLTLRVQAFNATAGAYAAPLTTTGVMTLGPTAFNPPRVWGLITFPAPFVSKQVLTILGHGFWHDGTANPPTNIPMGLGVVITTAATITSKARLIASAGNINTGKVRLLKRLTPTHL